MNGVTMNRLVAIILLASAITASGELSLGLNLKYSATNNFTDNTSTKVTTTSNSFYIRPYIGIHPTKLVEVSPFVGWSLSSNSRKTEYSNTNSTTESSSSQGALWLGCGLFFHVVRGEVFGVSIGPELGYGWNFEPSDAQYDKYYNADIRVACPLNIDLHFTKTFSARLSTDLALYNFNATTTEAKNSSTEIKNHTSTFDLRSIFQPIFGLYFNF